MKILIASYYPLPALGGIWSFVSQLKERLEPLGHNVEILSHNSNATTYRIIGRQPELSISQLTNYINPKLRRVLPKHSNQWIDNTEKNRYTLELAALYYGLNQYDIIHAQDVIAAQALRRVKPKHIPLVTSAHGYLSGGIFYHLKTLHRSKTDEQIKQMLEYQYHNKLEYEGYHASDYIHTPSKWSYGKVVNEFSVSPQKIFTFSDGMDIEGFLNRSKGSSPISRPKDKKVIIFTGRLVFLKGIQYLIEALAKLKIDRSDWECWILGEGPMKDELQGRCKTLGLTNEIKFLGVTNNVPHFLKQADIFVLPGLQDTHPHSLMEAQLIGLPVIVSNASALPEMVANGENGLVFPVGNSQQLYLKLKYLLENDLIREKFSIHAKAWAHERWSIDKMIHNILKLYHQAIESNKNP